MTRFEEGAAELVRRRLRLDPGPITIGLHPGLKEEPALMRHTLAHELLHAIGLLEHNEEHEHWVEKMAPLPKLSDSALLQQIQQRYLGQSSQKGMDMWSLCIYLASQNFAKANTLSKMC